MIKRSIKIRVDAVNVEEYTLILYPFNMYACTLRGQHEININKNINVRLIRKPNLILYIMYLMRDFKFEY